MVKKPSSRKLSVYSNLAHKRRTKKDAKARKKAEYLATLPKHPVKRLLYRMHPKRVYQYWFSKKGALMAAKILGVGALLLVLLIGGLFAYFRKDIDSIRPGELSKNVFTTVTKYYDRNGKLLWEDKGNGDYKLVVKSEEINKYMKDATIAIEDRDFYNHHGVSPTGLARAFLNNAQGGSTQGGSTLTQQLVKQVFFADEALERGINGIPRKIKELILSIEVERMYNKEQILTLYLNQSPYGGRRNGVESAAQTYFGVHAKDLTLAQASLLAAIPNQPGLYDPYNIEGNEALIARQHKVLNNMVEQGSITKKEADETKKIAVLDSIKPESSQYVGMKAQHFVQSVRKQLEAQLGKATVGRGGLSVKTTLDLRIQEKLEEAMKEEFADDNSRPRVNGYSNGAATVEDVKTGQILAEMGSRGWDAPGIGQDNAAEAFIQPGSSVKPLVYAQLLKDKGANQLNYGSGSILRDEPIDNIYGAKLQNSDRTFKGNLTIRQGLAQSRNVPAVKAMAIGGVQPTLQTIRDTGDKYYCTQGNEVQTGLSSAIGGCGTRQVDHVNAFTTLARNGSYIKQSSILEVKDSKGEVTKKWKEETKQVIDPQVTYIISDILNDANARRPLFGSITRGFSYENTGIRTATKTGTSDFDGKPKDLWIMTYSPAIAMGVWLGNSDNTPLRAGNSTLPGYIVDKVMRYAHLEIYAKEGKWKPNDWFTQPNGIQVISQNGTKELYPSWYKKNQGQSGAKQMFDKVSKKKATDCTPTGAKVELDVIKSVDPVTKKDILIAPGGYDGSKEDDVHKCDDAKPSFGGITVNKISGNEYRITVSVAQGTHPLKQLDIKVGGAVISSVPINASGEYSATYTITSPTTVGAMVTDNAFYTAESSNQYEPV